MTVFAVVCNRRKTVNGAFKAGIVSATIARINAISYLRIIDKSTMNPNTEYERFTREIYQLLAQATQVKTIKIQHNVKLEGLSGQMHQIDVYWEYEYDGIAHRVAIECKNYSRRVSLEKVCAFKGVLDDFDGVDGIMVSKVGFQKGAKKYARQYKIALKELRTPKYGETIIGEIENHTHMEVRYTLFWIDEDWAIENGFDIPNYRSRLSVLYSSRTELWDSAPYSSRYKGRHYPRQIRE